MTELRLTANRFNGRGATDHYRYVEPRLYVCDEAGEVYTSETSIAPWGQPQQRSGIDFNALRAIHRPTRRLDAAGRPNDEPPIYESDEDRNA